MSTSGKRPANNLDPGCAKKQHTSDPNKVTVAFWADDKVEMYTSTKHDEFPEFLDTIPVEQKVDMQIILSQVDNQLKTVDEIYTIYLRNDKDIINTIMECIMDDTVGIHTIDILDGVYYSEMDIVKDIVGKKF